MTGNKKTQKILDDLGALIKQALDSMEIDDFYGHFCTKLRIARENYEDNLPYAMSAEKIAALEKAVEEFDLVYEAEKAEAAKMPLSWHEAKRVLKLFEDAGDVYSAPPEPRIEN